MNRPTVTKIKNYSWLQHRQETPGIALINDQRILVHMTPSEALAIAHGIADLLEGQDQIIHTNRTEA